MRTSSEHISAQRRSPVLDVRDLEVRYGRLKAVDGLALHVNEGEIVGIVGPNGAGKSSTLGAIAGTRDTSGSIVFEGRPILGQAPEVIARSGLSLVPEGRHIFGTLTVGENLRIATMHSSTTGAANFTLDFVLDEFPFLADVLDRPASQLSGGQQQQLAIARALLTNPRLLMLDEPSLGIAPRVVDVIFGIMDRLRRAGVAILLVEQELLRTVQLADRTYLMRTGKIVRTGTRDTMGTRDDILSEYFGVESTA